jgi:predicted neuraminidase
MSRRLLILGLAVACSVGLGVDLTQASAVLKSEFICAPDSRPTPCAHASTIVALADGTLVAAWFGGAGEGRPDVGIWLARQGGGKWTRPIEVAAGLQPDGKRLPCWNPVLFQPARGPLLLFFKVGSSPRSWWGEMMISDDGGRTWRGRKRLPHDGIGPVKNKPLELADGKILCPSSEEAGDQWRVHFELTPDLGRTWVKSRPLAGCDAWPSIQPAILKHKDGKLQILCRTRGKGVLAASVSADGGRTWSAMAGTDLPNPNSGIDALTLRDGRHLLVYNPLAAGRSPLAVAISRDGRAWKKVLTLEDEPGQEFSYPAVIQAQDGRVHLTYTWKRLAIRHVVLDPEALPFPVRE